jgi:DNA-binding transcriptional MerR regulator
MDRATAKDVAKLAGVSKTTVVRFSRRGLIDNIKDVNGWRVYPNPEKTAERIKGLLSGDIQIEKGGQGEDSI